MSLTSVAAADDVVVAFAVVVVVCCQSVAVAPFVVDWPTIEQGLRPRTNLQAGLQDSVGLSYFVVVVAAAAGDFVSGQRKLPPLLQFLQLAARMSPAHSSAAEDYPYWSCLYLY